ncbi:putative TraG family protein (plasmid) [Pseudomonas veronii 1YdBTEX2]|uniref:Type IV secretion system DNA-binding domain-containing protein n=2 Tax=Pseudomonas veronii TaxID=76761 RepID=A0A7Y1FBP2_PSEVE|nr:MULTISPECIES: TraM recognition domain-containing protein [Pseudomonas]KAA0946255.1 conjugal transfer protein TraG [Pseudomonas sp. ANT_H4]NMY12471.1 type IV secretion system DNA-binding domain-containing protein [Pseudomonas veronii]SBW85342.1 putative TraG family protein [Pseudomonas veronii 1YdBTEX2]
MSMEKILRSKIGGTLDTLALSSMGAGGVLTSPYFGSLSSSLPLALGAAGGAYIGNRLFQFWKDQLLLDSKINIRSATDLVRPDGMLVGYTTDTGSPVHIPDEDLMRHGFILGQSGVGKTVLGKLLMFQQIQRGGGLTFIDGKMNADDIQTIYQYCCWAGREQDLLILNPGNPELSNTYNPILRGDPDEVAARILSIIPSTENNPGADHYKQSANQGIATLVAAFQAAGLAYNFIDFTILLMNHKAIEELETRLKKTQPHNPATKNLSLFLEQYKVGGGTGKPGLENMVDIKRMKETFGGLAGRMYMFGTGKFGEVLNTYTPDIDLFEAIRAKKIIYVALPTMGKNEAASNFGKMFLGDFRTAISWVQALPEEERPNPPHLNFMDELGSYAVHSLARPFEQGRSAQMALFPAAQTLANLDVVSPDFKEMIIGNTWTKIFFKIGTQATAVECADLIGMKIGIAKSLSGTQNESSSSPLLNVAPEGGTGAAAGISEGEREQEEYKVSPDDLKALGKGECIIQYGGDQIFNVRVPMITIDKKLQKEIGRIRINHFRKASVEGADYFKNSDKYLGGSGKPTGARKVLKELADE